MVLFRLIFENNVEYGMKVTLPDFNKANVLVVGDVMLDRYWYGPTSRISPEAPVPVVKVDTIEERPGGAANVAMNIASLGANSRLVGLTGIDEAAKALSNTLSQVNVRCDFVSIATHPTITKLRVLSRNQQLIRLDFEEGFSNVSPEPIYERIQQALPSMGALILSDYAKGALSHVQQMIQLAKKAGATTIVGIDPIAQRRELAEKYGADYTLDPMKADVGFRLKELTDKRGVDSVIETSGSAAALQASLRGIGYGGIISYVAFAKPFPAGFNLGREAHFNNAKIVFARASSEPNPDYPRWNRKRIEDTCWELLMNGYLDCEEIIDPVVPFAESAEAYMRYVDQHPEESIKMGVQVRGGEQ